MHREAPGTVSAARRSVPAALLLACLAMAAAGCGQKPAAVAALPKEQVSAEADAPASPPQQQASAGAGSPSFLPDPKATIDNVKRKLDAAAAQDQARREQIEEQTK